MSESRLIVGLGNPGKEYQLTRHNLGFDVVQALARRWRLSFTKSSECAGFVADGRLFDCDICLLMPTTYMNRSGEAVKAVLARRNIDAGHVLVICDDLQLPFGRLRLRRRGSDGGHNGLSSIIEHLGTDHFARLRCGIGSPADPQGTVDYVLEKFSKEERQHLDAFVGEAAECCEAWIREDMETVMNRFNIKS